MAIGSSAPESVPFTFAGEEVPGEEFTGEVVIIDVVTERPRLARPDGFPFPPVGNIRFTEALLFANISCVLAIVSFLVDMVTNIWGSMIEWRFFGQCSRCMSHGRSPS